MRVRQGKVGSKEVMVMTEELWESLHPRVRKPLSNETVFDRLWERALVRVATEPYVGDRTVLLQMIDRIRQNEPRLLEKGEALLRYSGMDTEALPELCFYMAQEYQNLIYLLLNADMEHTVRTIR